MQLAINVVKRQRKSEKVIKLQHNKYDKLTVHNDDVLKEYEGVNKTI